MLKESAKKAKDGIEKALIYCDYPSEYWSYIRIYNIIEQLNRKIRRRTHMASSFPVGNFTFILGPVTSCS